MIGAHRARLTMDHTQMIAISKRKRVHVPAWVLYYINFLYFVLHTVDRSS